MKTRIWLPILLAVALGPSWEAQNPPKAAPTASSSDGLTPSVHRPGPHGLEGWTLNGPLPDGPEDKYPFILVIARDGREIQRFNGSAFVWKWMFVDDGRHVAYESGPLHFGMTCILADLETGHELETYDCYQELPADAPQWVEALEALR